MEWLFGERELVIVVVWVVYILCAARLSDGLVNEWMRGFLASLLLTGALPLAGVLVRLIPW